MKKEELKMKDWKEKKFSQIFKVQSSKRVLKKDWKKKGVPFYRAREVVKLSEQGYVDNDLFISEELFNEYIQTSGKPKKDDIIISAVGTLGKCYIVKKEDKFYFKDASVLWLEKKDSNVDSRFIKYGFNTEILRNQIINNSLGATVGTLTIVKTRNLKIPLPPLHEQRRIVSKLDSLFAEIDASLALIDKNIDQAEALKLSVLEEEFGRIEHKEKLAKVTNFSPKKSEVRDMGNMECSFLPMKDLNEKQIDFQPQEIRKIEDVYKGYTYFKDNDVLLAKVTPCFQNRKAGVAKNLTNGIGFGSSEYFVFRPSAKIMSEYLYYFLMTTDFINKGVVNMSGAVGLKRVTTDYIKRVEIPLPDLNHQKNVVNKIQNVFVEVDGLVKDYKQKRENLEALKASLLDSAFKGEL